MADLQELVLRIRADAGQLDRELKKAQGAVQQSTSRMSSSFAGLASELKALAPALGAAAFVNFARNSLVAADRINDLAARTGFSTETLSAFNLQLIQGGTNLEEFSSSIGRMNNLIGEAAKGTNEQAAAAFERLGLSVRDLINLTPEQQFSAIARALANVKNQAEFTNIGMDIFGRSFAALSPVIRQTNGNIDDFVEKARKAGLVIDDEQSKKIGEFFDSWDEGVLRLQYAMANAMPALKLYLDGLSAILNLPQNAFEAGGDLARALGLAGNPNVSSRRPGETRIVRGASARAEIDAALRARGLPGLGSDSGSRASSGSPSQNIERAAKAAEDYNSHIEEYNRVMAEAKRQSEAFTESIKNNLSQGLTQAVFAADSAGDAFSRMAMQIAQAIFERSVSQPLSNSIVNAIDGASIFNGLSSMFGGFFADGGSPPVGRPSIVGENGAEVFVPRVPGTILPNGVGMGGQSVTVQQYFQVSNDVPSLIEAHIRNAAPVIAKAAHEAVFSSIRRGGSASKIVGLRG